MARDFCHKRPNPHTRFSWGRVRGNSGAITYRLFRRDFRNTLHMELVRFDPGSDRAAMASKLRDKRRGLLASVDSIELQLLGVT
jgi:hypothetical protein